MEIASFEIIRAYNPNKTIIFAPLKRNNHDRSKQHFSAIRKKSTIR